LPIFASLRALGKLRLAAKPVALYREQECELKHALA
jgi:hypothetical protein